MENRRYGKFRLIDYCESWIVILILLIYTAIGFILQQSALSVMNVILMVFALIWIWKIVSPNLERFSIKDDKIIVRKGKSKREISISSELCLIISYADICPPLSKRISFRDNTHILNGRYAVTILKKMQIETVLERLHQVQITKYTTSTIETFFDGELYIYSFVCNHELLDQLLNGRECDLIIPESLLKKVDFELSYENIYIDLGY